MRTNEHIRLSQKATILLNCPIEEAFMLLTPLGEIKWVPGWNPDFIYPLNGEMQEGLVFKTKSSTKEEPSFNWIVSKFQPMEFLSEYTVSTQNRIWVIRVECSVEKEKTIASVSYTYTALNDLGVRLNQESIIKMYAENLKDWENAINAYLSQN